jgi:hypothetical protein
MKTIGILNVENFVNINNNLLSPHYHHLSFFFSCPPSTWWWTTFPYLHTYLHVVNGYFFENKLSYFLWHVSLTTLKTPPMLHIFLSHTFQFFNSRAVCEYIKLLLSTKTTVILRDLMWLNLSVFPAKLLISAQCSLLLLWIIGQSPPLFLR